MCWDFPAQLCPLLPSAFRFKTRAREDETAEYSYSLSSYFFFSVLFERKKEETTSQRTERRLKREEKRKERERIKRAKSSVHCRRADDGRGTQEKGVVGLIPQTLFTMKAAGDGKNAFASVLQIFPPSVEFRNVEVGKTYTATLKVKVCMCERVH